MKKYSFPLRLILLGLTPVSLLLILLAKGSAALTEQYFSLGFYRYWSAFLSRLTSPLPFSLAEVLVILSGISVLVFLIFLVRGCLVRGRSCLPFLRRQLLSAGSVLSVVFFLFTISSGLNYYRQPFLFYSGLEIRPSTVSELEALCSDLASQANQLRQGRGQDARGVFSLSQPFDELAQAGAQGYASLMEENPEWAELFSVSAATRAKPVFFSEAMSYMQIVGVFFPFTMEANVNVHTSDINIPFFICHELAHISGMMREDEANYLGYLACMASGDPDLAYSGTVGALIHASNALYSYDTEAHARVTASLEEGVLRDLQADSDYYYAHRTRFGEFSESVNDAYLRANSQPDGVASYGRMVDLLLARRRALLGNQP